MRIAQLLVSSLLSASSVAAQVPAPGATKIATVEGITEYRLPNGLRVLLFPDQSKPTVTVNITYMVGSRFEGYGETGMAHLLEHLQFKGTTTRHDINGEMDKHGARSNASTWVDRTNYFEIMPATVENLTWALDLEADRMTNSLIAQKDLNSEMTVVRNEFEAGENDPFNVLLERTFSSAYLWHNYGHSTIGARSDIEQVPIGRLQAFYHLYYQPDNAVLLVAGKFDPEKVLPLIERRFARIPRAVRSQARGNLLYPTYTREPTQDGERSVTLRRVGDVQLALALYHVPALSHPDYPAVDVLGSVLGDRPSGRLYQALVVPKIAANAGAFDFGFKEPGSLMAYAQVRQDGSLDSARAVLLRTVDSLRTRPPTSEEVERAKTSLLKAIDLALNSSDQVGLWISEWQAAGDWRLLFVTRDRIKQVTPADLARVARTYLLPSNVTVGMFYPTAKPERAEIPEAADIASMVRDYRGDTAYAAGETFDASPANIDARLRLVTFPNGLRLTVLPKQTRGNGVNGRLVLRFGTEQSLGGQATSADLAAEMLSRGTATLSRQQFKDSVDRLKARVSVASAPGQVTIVFETISASVPALLDLIADMARTPRFDAKEFDQLKQEQLADLEQFKSDPEALAPIALDRRLEPRPPGHPLYTPTIDEHVAAISGTTVEQAQRFHQAFYNAAAGDLVVIGKVDTAAVRALVDRRFGAWTATAATPWTRIPHPFARIDSSTTTIETPDKANAMLLAGLNVRMRDEDPEYAALVLGNEIVGGSLSSRLWTRIRERDGLSYGVYSRLRVRAADDGGRWRVIAIYAPQNLGRLVTDMNEELARVLKEGVTAAELERAKASVLQEREQARSNDDELAALIVARRDAGRTLVYDETLDGRLRAATLQQVNEALRKYIDTASFTVVRAGDFAHAKTAAPPPSKP